ncbi:hypothetical protein CCP3SC15_6680001 [Gammaproteobacteria bacterium]
MNRCRGWTRRSWFLSQLAIAAADRLREASQRLGLPLMAVGDIATFNAGLRHAGRPFPVRSLEFHVPEATLDDLEQLYAAVQGSAAEAIRARRLNLILRADSRHPDANTPAGHIVWLATRNWCRFPPGRLRWILEVMASIELEADPVALSRQIVVEARRYGTVATVAQAFRFITATSTDPQRYTPILESLSVEPIPLASYLRLWRARHPFSLGLRSGAARLRAMLSLSTLYKSHAPAYRKDA